MQVVERVRRAALADEEGDERGRCDREQPDHERALFGTGAKLMPRISEPTRTTTASPPRLSTGSVVSFTCAGTKRSAMTSATTASGSVSRKTEPHQKCSSRIPAQSGPSAPIAPPVADHSAIDRVRAGARPERGDQRERRRVGHAGGEPAEDARDDQHLDRSAPRPRGSRPGS